MALPIVRVAHRGASVECPENTLLAFERAMAYGVDALEIDVHLSQDRELVVIHDPTLDRTTNGTGRIADRSLAELRNLDAGHGQRIPALAEVLALVQATPVRLCVEITGETEQRGLSIAEAVVRALETADFLGRAMVTSFSAAALLKVKALQPALPTMLDPWPQDGTLSPRQICEQTLRAGANSLSFDFEHVNKAVADEARRTGLALWPWSPCAPDDIRRMLALAVPGIMTDRPDVLNQVLNAS
jgi:glycerophosphoryl diester phosphodiesterase